MKKSLLLSAGAMLMAASAFAQKDVTPSGYDFSKYEDGELFTLTPCNTTGWSVTANFFNDKGEEAIADHGHLTTLVQRGTAFNDQAAIDAISKNVFIKDMGAAGKCLILSEPHCPIIPDASPAGFNGQPQLNFYMDPALFDNLDDPHYVRVKMVFNTYQRGCHFINKNPNNVKTAGAWIANTYATCDRGWVVPEADHENPDGSFWGIDFARWVGETGKSADIPANPEVVFVTDITPDEEPLDPTHNAGSANHNQALYLINPDRYMIVEWDVPYNYSFGTVSVQFNLANANSNAVIKEIKFTDLGTDEGAATLLGKRKISYIYADEMGATEEPGNEFADGEYYFRNVETGYYLNSGMTWGTLAVVKPQPRAVTLKGNDDGTYNATTSLGDFKVEKPESTEMYMDGNGTATTVLTPKDNYYTIAVNGKYLVANEHFNWLTSEWHKDQPHCDEGEQYTIKLVDDANEAGLWEILSREEMLAAFANATADEPAEASFLLKAASISVKDPENTTWKYTVNGEDAEIVFPEGGWGSGMKDWHNNDTYAWLLNDEPEADGEDILAQEIEGAPAGTYVATYRIVNQDNTPLIVKFNDTEAEAHPYSGTDLWHNSVCEPLKNGVKTAKFTVGEDGKLSIKMIKQSKAGEQNRFAFKHVYLAYIGEAAAEEVEDGKTAETAWQVSTPEDIEAMKDKVSAAAPTYFKLMNDIDMTGVNHIPAVGNQNNDFGKTIHFDGNNHVISNLTSHSTQIEGTDTYDFYYASLFGVFQGSVKNLGLVDVDLKSTLGVAGIGGYVGYGNVATTVDNCYVTGKINAIGGYAAGIMGTNSADATVSNCYAQVDVTGKDFAGGLVGRGKSPITLNNCYVSGTVAGEGIVSLVATTRTSDNGTIVINNVVAVNTGADDDTNYGANATGTVSKDINAVKTWEAFNEGKLFNGLPALNWQEVEASGIDEIASDDNNAPVEYYNLQGIRVENPANGLYIRKQGSKATKVLIR